MFKANSVSELKTQIDAQHHAAIDAMVAHGIDLGTILGWLNGPQGQLLLGLLGGLLGQIGKLPVTTGS